MTDKQIEMILADPDKYLDGSLQIEACVSYDRNTGWGDHAELDEDDDPTDCPPFPEMKWGGDGWYENGTLTDIEQGLHGPRFSLDLEGGGQAENYGRGDVEIVDERFPELLGEVEA